MITIKPPEVDLIQAPLAPISPRRRGQLWSSRLSAALLALSVVTSFGGGGMVDLGAAYSLQARPEALRARWASMLDNGIPSAYLAPLRPQWPQPQARKLVGRGALCGWPAGAGV